MEKYNLIKTGLSLDKNIRKINVSHPQIVSTAAIQLIQQQFNQCSIQQLHEAHQWHEHCTDLFGLGTPD